MSVRSFRILFDIYDIQEKSANWLTVLQYFIRGAKQRAILSPKNI